ncbi:hypothetical protein ACIA48_13180 [Mycobacterium sp. NPDC051804]|uniref:hypothetical protein n=1 Tax=Mycobacterium sp. NPDC051804 TaxID=3364295 RepID=UPI0037A8C8C6
MINLTTTTRPTFHKTVVPSPVVIPAPSSEGTTLITEQQVLFATAAAVAVPRVRPSHWSAAVKAISHAMTTVFTDSRPSAQRYQAQRFTYLENALMSREMGRL